MHSSVPRRESRRMFPLAFKLMVSLSIVGAAADRQEPFPAASEISPTTNHQPDTAISTRFSEAYGKLPLHFEANQGQTDPRVKFLAHGGGYTLFLTATDAVLLLSRRETNGLAARGENGWDREVQPTIVTKREYVAE